MAAITVAVMVREAMEMGALVGVAMARLRAVVRAALVVAETMLATAKAVAVMAAVAKTAAAEAALAKAAETGVALTRAEVAGAHEQ